MRCRCLLRHAACSIAMAGNMALALQLQPAKSRASVASVCFACPWRDKLGHHHRQSEVDISCCCLRTAEGLLGRGRAGFRDAAAAAAAVRRGRHSQCLQQRRQGRRRRRRHPGVPRSRLGQVSVAGCCRLLVAVCLCTTNCAAVKHPSDIAISTQLIYIPFHTYLIGDRVSSALMAECI